MILQNNASKRSTLFLSLKSETTKKSWVWCNEQKSSSYSSKHYQITIFCLFFHLLKVKEEENMQFHKQLI